MRVLVAGGTGFIGTNLCAELNDRGHEVTALSRNPDRGDLPTEIDLAMGDVSAYDSIVDVVAEHDAVVNLVSLSPLFQPPAGTSHEEVHLQGTENLVRAAESGGADRFVQMSALDADPNADTEFLRTKGEAEEYLRNSDLAWTIFRPSVVFGEGDEFVGFTKTLTTPYVTGLPGGGRTRFQPIWVGDLVPILADGLEDEHLGEIYEVAGPQVLTLADVTELAYDAEGTSVTVLPIPMPFAKIGLALANPIPFVPFGPDQARSLEMNNTVATNDVTAFGVDEAELTTLGSYLGRPPR
ncbi:complex I NDUFA9 subunit family protein [Natrialba swarupiae]|uniref:Complex I NDUFA9 subunit family protein n=1 Tax=Natrialba swarupiae TaxID=2448032 RepID=A0A5D5ATQ1_9EURY|nr:complex I NDUFA9 subunit family protein [Natrialba swarupiae]TYT62920.1 complex I NDUFA9 subunit family protein [Natrialba swarupiae]